MRIIVSDTVKAPKYDRIQGVSKEKEIVEALVDGSPSVGFLDTYGLYLFSFIETPYWFLH
jgi:hypothetical protein